MYFWKNFFVCFSWYRVFSSVFILFFFGNVELIEFVIEFRFEFVEEGRDFIFDLGIFDFRGVLVEEEGFVEEVGFIEEEGFVEDGRIEFLEDVRLKGSINIYVCLRV